jgi:hypothetical protein
VDGKVSVTNIVNNNTASTTGNYFENIINGVSSGVKQFINSLSQNVSGNVLTTNINGVISTTTVISSNNLSSSGNTLTSTVNGVATNGANIINSLSQNVSGNTLTTIVNGMTATTTVISSNNISYATSTDTFTATINGVTATTSLGIVAGNYLPLTGGTITGNINMSASIIPTANNTYSLGSASSTWKDVYIGPGSLYVNGQEVVHTDTTNDVVITADPNQSVRLYTQGSGDIEMNPSGGGQILLKQNLVLTGGKALKTSNDVPILSKEDFNPFYTNTFNIGSATALWNNVYANHFITTGGSSSQFVKGDGSLDSSTYYPNNNPSNFISLSSLSATSPLSYSTTTGAFTIQQANPSQSGYLNSTDWNTFNNKQAALTFSGSLTNSGNTVTLVNDNGVPGNSMYYGTNGSGTKGYYSIPSTGTWGLITGTLSAQIDLQTALNAKQENISLTTTGSSGSSTLISNVLNIPTYTLSGLGGEPTITTSTTSKYWRGDKTFQTLDTSVVPENTNLYFTNARAIASTLTGYVSGAGTISSTDSILGAIQKLNGNIEGLVTGVSSVSNSDGTLTISTTTGAVVASLNLGHANTWTGQQTFNTSAPIFGTMTAGSVLFAGTAGVLSQDNANLFWDSTNHRLGLGTTAPSAILDVVSSVTDGTKFTTNGYSNWNNIVSFNNNSPAGFFGLNISSYSDSSNRIIRITGNNTTGIQLPDGISTLNWNLYNGYYNSYWQDANFYLRNTTGGLGGFKFTSIVTGNLMSILENGNVGIGTPNPLSKLHIGVAPTASANSGTISLGGGAFNGSTAGFFRGSGSGTSLAINEVSGYAGDLMNLQISGVSYMKVNPTNTTFTANQYTFSHPTNTPTIRYIMGSSGVQVVGNSGAGFQVNSSGSAIVQIDSRVSINVPIQGTFSGLTLYSEGSGAAGNSVQIAGYTGSAWENAITAPNTSAGKHIDVFLGRGGGNVRIGDGTTPVSKLNIGVAPIASANYGTFSLGGGAFNGSTAGFFTGNPSGTSLAVNEVSGYGGNLLDLQVAGSSKFNVSATGVATFANLASCGGIQTNGAGTMSCSSDERLKDVHADFTKGLDAIMKIDPKAFSWKEGTNMYDNGIIYNGFIAQNVQIALPEAVATSSDGVHLQVSQLTIMAAVVNAIKDIGHIAGTFKDNLITWLGDSTNGLKKMSTDQICLKDSSGKSVCIDGDKLQQLISNQNNSSSTNNNGNNNSSSTNNQNLSNNNSNNSSNASSTPIVDSSASSTNPNNNASSTPVVDNTPAATSADAATSQASSGSTSSPTASTSNPDPTVATTQ